MLKMLRSFIASAILACFIYCPAAEARDKSISIGVIYGFSGDAAIWASYGRMGLELARDEINAAGGIQGRPLKLIFEDSHSSPAKAVSAYRKLVSVDGVKFVIGDLWSILSNPLAPLAERDRVIVISPTVMDASVEKTNPYFFSMGHHIDSLRKAVDTFFKANPEVKTIGILCHDDAWGHANSKLWRESAETVGVRVEEEICQNNYISEFTSDIARLAARKVDAVFCPTHMDTVSRRMREQNFNARRLATSGLIEPLELKLPGHEYLEEAYFTDWKPSAAFTQSFRAKFGKDPILEAHNHYETLRSIAKTLEISAGDHLKALKKVRYEGVAGPIDFSSTQFPNLGQAKLFQVKNGKAQLVE